MKTDVLIIGSGAAGLTAALNLAETRKVAVMAKGPLGGGATEWAQGGIAAVLEEGDSFEAHVEDTMVAGAGLNDRAVVEHVVAAGPKAIGGLIGLSPFATKATAHLTREGGHSHRRIVHSPTPRLGVQNALEQASSPIPNRILLTGSRSPDHRPATPISSTTARSTAPTPTPLEAAGETLTARATVLATGGAGRAYLYSSATGSHRRRIAMACAPGAASRHGIHAVPPALPLHLETKNFLITEAVRGEGGILRNPRSGERFMPSYDTRAELAPRDIVARAIDSEIKRDGLDFVWLDISHQDPEFVRGHFPTIYDKLIGLGIDITREPIPVVPAQHYTCGGVLVDLAGRTDAQGLYAAGEVTHRDFTAPTACVQFLLECLVFGEVLPATSSRWENSRRFRKSVPGTGR